MNSASEHLVCIILFFSWVILCRHMRKIRVIVWIRILAPSKTLPWTRLTDLLHCLVLHLSWCGCCVSFRQQDKSQSRHHASFTGDMMALSSRQSMWACWWFKIQVDKPGNWHNASQRFIPCASIVDLFWPTGLWQQKRQDSCWETWNGKGKAKVHRAVLAADSILFAVKWINTGLVLRQNV